MNSHVFKLTIGVAATIASLAVVYNYAYVLPKQQKLKNCEASYTSDWKDSVVEKIRLSAIEICERGYSFSQFVDLARSVTAKVTEQYAELYADPDNWWVAEKREDEITKEIRKRILE